MAAPLTGSWAPTHIISAAHLNGTTMGSGTTTERNAITSWPQGRLFFDITEQKLYVNSNAGGGVTWALMSGEPAGTVKVFAGVTVPNGFLLCDGRAVSRATYASLFAAIGTRYGAGNGTTTFNLPNLTEKFIRGASSASYLGVAGGSDTVTLTPAQMPAHSHSMTDNGIERNTSQPGWDEYVGTTQLNLSTRNYTKSTGSAGGGGSHENKPPFVNLFYIIRT